jgi:hypothetical protein
MMDSDRSLQEMRDNQNLGLGLVGGAAGAALGAFLWGVVTALSGWQIGWIAVGVGFLAGAGVRFLGRGVDPVFGVLGAILSLAGCLAGNLLAVCMLVARQRQLPVMEILASLTPESAIALLKAGFDPMDLVFYGIAVYEGYRFSIVKPPAPAPSAGV